MEGADEKEDGKFSALLFDLDDTLYPLSSGIAAACRQRIEQYMVEKLGLDAAQVPQMCSRLYQEHGTTLAGLIATGARIDVTEFHYFVNTPLPYEVLRPDTVLASLLHSMPQRKLVFTNADKIHAFRVLHRLGLEDCFEGVICYESVQPEEEEDPSKPSRVVCKPSLDSFQRAIAIASIDPSTTLFLDDSVRNVAAAKTAGFHTVLVGSPVRTQGADHAVESLHNLREAVPEIWEASLPTYRDLPYSSSAIAIETPVQA